MAHVTCGEPRTSAQRNAGDEGITQCDRSPFPLLACLQVSRGACTLDIERKDAITDQGDRILQTFRQRRLSFSRRQLTKAEPQLLDIYGRRADFLNNSEIEPADDTQLLVPLHHGRNHVGIEHDHERKPGSRGLLWLRMSSIAWLNSCASSLVKPDVPNRRCINVPRPTLSLLASGVLSAETAASRIDRVSASRRRPGPGR